MRVLLVEDDDRMAAAVRRGLEAEGIAVDHAASGEDALWRVQAAGYAVIVLDLGLPGIDGIQTCQRLREAGIWAPILMLTARDGVQDRVGGLNSGADDYLAKPFAFDELLARLRALARREPAPRPTVLQIGNLRLDTTHHHVWRGAEQIDLSAREVAILEVFMQRPGRILSRDEILELVWDGDFDHRSNVVDVAIRRLRDKIDRPFQTESIQTVRGAGYRLCTP